MGWEWKPEEIAEAAHDACEEWFTGYTNHLEDGRQRKIILVGREDEDNQKGYRVYEIMPLDYHGMPDHNQTKRYKLTIQVTEHRD